MGNPRPYDVYQLPEGERGERVQSNDELCIIDGGRFFVRGVLELPARDGGAPYEWGCWAEVGRADFEKYYSLYEDDGSGEPPFAGNLSAELPGYPPVFRHPVTVQLRSVDLRPAIRLVPSGHPLVADQDGGLTEARWMDLLEAAIPGFRSHYEAEKAARAATAASGEAGHAHGHSHEPGEGGGHCNGQGGCGGHGGCGRHDGA